MVEDSVESFVAEWRRYAVTAWLFPRVEGSPLLECEVNGRIFHVFERTNPYAGSVGEAKIIVHAVTDAVGPGGGETFFETLGTSRLKLGGRVAHAAPGMLVVEAGFPVVVGLLTPPEVRLQPGDFAELTTLPPLHGFVLSETRVNQLTYGL